MKQLRLLVILVPLLWVAGCSTMKPSDYAGTEPRLDLFDYFAGETRAWGIFQGRSGELKRQFTVDITGTWNGQELVLDERFAYSDGERDRRVWPGVAHLTRVIWRAGRRRPENSCRGAGGRAGDVISGPPDCAVS